MKVLPPTLLLLFLFFACVPRQESIQVNPFQKDKGTPPWVIAHGGAKKLFPGNTMLAFRGAAKIGVDMLEMDVRMTKDEVLVTHHDETIDRMSNGTGRVFDYTYEELLQFNFGYSFKNIDGDKIYQNDTIPLGSLDDVFAEFNDMFLMVELKDKGENGRRAAEILKSLIQKYKLQDNIVAVAFNEEVLSYFHQITNGEILIGTSEEETKDFIITAISAMEFLYFPKATVVAIPTQNSGIQLDSKRIINSAHRRNIAVHYWTINDKAEMKRLIGLGADGLITDRPDLMKEVLVELGY